jgi:hypothetical protein
MVNPKLEIKISKRNNRNVLLNNLIAYKMIISINMFSTDMEDRIRRQISSTDMWFKA